MYFHKIEVQVSKNDKSSNKSETKRFAKALDASFSSSMQSEKEGMIFIYAINGNAVTFGAIAKESTWLEINFPLFLVSAEMECRKIETEETSFHSVTSMLRTSQHREYVCEDAGALKRFGLDKLAYNCALSYSEHLLRETIAKDQLTKTIDSLMCADTLLPEIERIYQPKVAAITGHPVHYFIQCDNTYICDRMYITLITALYSNGRLQNRRYSVVSLSESNCDKDECQALYEACTGGAIVIKCGEKTAGGITAEERLLRAIFGEKYKEDDSIKYGKDSDDYWLSTLCRTAMKYRNQTLTIFCLPRTSERIKAAMQAQLDLITLVEVTENHLSRDRANNYLQQLAQKQEIIADESLYEALDSEQTAFSSTELERVFNVWYSKRLKMCAYPQYSSFVSSGQVSAKVACSGEAYKELERLIGLNEAKSVIKQSIDYFKVQEIFRERGLNNDRPTMHMVFNGAPGTAKTTVARLFAQIMRESELLSVGKLYEVGRADLVGRYVGWTAQKVEAKFQEAMGSVLFIDEAYSLADEQDGSYGDEAISTIVSEMENRRADIVVIFAGYPDKMQEFLRKNPGLRSRIAFHVSFTDYSVDELYSILEYLASKQSMTLDNGVREKVLPFLSSAKNTPDFGNGRFVRSILDKARMKQASRLLASDIDNVTDSQLMRLMSDDFDAPTVALPSMQRIGFYIDERSA